MGIRAYEKPPYRPRPKRVLGRPPGRVRKSTALAPLRGLLPAASRLAPTALTLDEEDLSADAVDVFAREVGGRQVLTDTLQIADASGQADRVVEILLDPRYESWSLRRICTSAGISVADLFVAYKKATLAKAHIEAIHVIASRVLPVVEDVMVRAAPVAVRCPECGGKAPKPGAPICLACQGSGLVRSEPELDRQKVALELAHLTEKKGGVIVNQNQVAAAAGSATTAQSGGTLEQLQQAVGDLLFAPGRRRKASPPTTTIDDPSETRVPHGEPPRVIDVPPQRDPDDDDTDTDDDEEEDPELQT